MRKMKLDLNDLAVESFATASARGGAGTVRARESQDMGGDTFNMAASCANWATCDDQCKPWTQQKDCPVNNTIDRNTAAPYHTCEPDTCVFTGCGSTADMNSCGYSDCSGPYLCTTQ